MSASVCPAGGVDVGKFLHHRVQTGTLLQHELRKYAAAQYVDVALVSAGAPETLKQCVALTAKLEGLDRARTNCKYYLSKKRVCPWVKR